MKNLQTYGRLFTLIAIFLGLTILSAAANSNQPLNEQLQDLHFPERLPHLTSPQTNTANIIPNPNPSNSNDISTWSQFIFQSYRDDNWEIYRMPKNRAHPNVTRITTNSGLDIHPHFNRGLSKIVFASERDGSVGLEIFTMDYDGNQLTRLTANGTDDVYPVWSPDGTRIAFESYRDGQAEIYVMDADGTNPIRLTNHPDYDGMPEWSPDGTRLAFVSRRTGGYRIYLMNIDGSQKTEISSQPYSLHPKWSPDGKNILFDADLDGDGWQDIWLMDSDGANQRMLVQTMEETHAWAAGWSPDSKQYTFTYILFSRRSGEWYWHTAYSYADTLIYPFPDRLETGSIKDWNPRWQTEDADPPISNLYNMPAYSSIHNFAINWASYDIGLAGLRGTDVQFFKNATDAWQDLVQDSPLTSQAFNAQPGETVYFRGRASDHAYNMEAWSINFDTQTTFYTNQLSGLVTTNRGAPLGGVNINTTPASLEESLTDENGRYTTRFLSNNPHQIVAVDNNYNTLPTTTFDLQINKRRDFYLPPSDDLIQNGGFENATPLQNWQVQGDLPVTNINQGHSGSKGIKFGQGCQAPCLGNLTPTEIDYTIRIVDPITDNEGTLFVVWYGFFSNQEGIFWSKRDAESGIWTDPEIIIPINWTGEVKAVFDQENRLNVVWTNKTSEEKQGVYAISQDETGSWLQPERITTKYSTLESNLFVDNQNHLHITAVMRNLMSQSIYLERNSAKVWQLPIVILEETSNPDSFLMAVGPDNSLHFILSNRSDTLNYFSRSADGNWEVEQHILPGYDEVPFFEVSPNGVLHMITRTPDNYHYAHTYRTLSDDQWATPFTFTAFNVDWMDIAIDKQDDLHMLTSPHGSGEYQGLFYHHWNLTSGWDEPYLVTENAESNLKITSDTYDMLHILRQTNGSQYQSWATAVTPQQATLSQSITIPANMQYPTLAFMQRSFRSSPNRLSGLTISVNDGVSDTVLPIQKGRTDWSQAWVDLTPWQGQTITIKFIITQVVGEPFVEVYLDDISLGSAHPDIWLTIAADTAGMPNEQVEIKLNYGNQSGAAAQSGQLLVHLPDALEFVTASIEPTNINGVNLIWNVGELTAVSPSQTISITVQIKPNAPTLTTIPITANITTASQELELGNNEATAELFIGRRLYLPSVAR